jgi:hypothetical protein
MIIRRWARHANQVPDSSCPDGPASSSGKLASSSNRTARGEERSASSDTERAVHDPRTGRPASSGGTRPLASTTSAWKGWGG